MITTRTGSKRLLRDLNRSIALNLIAGRGPISRTELARESGLPAATITRIAGDFVRAGLVTETGSEESSGGRRPVLLTINPGAGHVVGVKLREDSMTVALCDLACTVVHYCEEPFASGIQPYQAVEVISAAVEGCIAEAEVSRAGVFGVGVGISGLIDSARGVCRYSAILGWSDVELGPALEFKLRMQVRIDNDVNTLAVAERHFGAGRDVQDFLLVTVGRGIGLGIVVGGEIYRGAHGGAGEFGHMTVDTSADAPLCNCGKRGCLEAIASDYGILRAASGADPGHHVEDAMAAVLARARNGDTHVRAIFSRAGSALGVALANLVNIFEPALLLIGGEGLRAEELITEPMRATLPQHVFGRSGEDVTLAVRRTTEVEWARGAASLVLREVFRPPIYDTGEEPVIDTLLASQRSRARKRG
jgi:N-acetylglucosamine repressor